MRKKIELTKITSQKTFEEGYKEFLIYCKTKNLRPATLKHDDSTVRHVWYKFISPKTPISNITNSIFDAFVMFCKNEMDENDITVNTNIRTMRTILYYFMCLGYMKKFKIHEIKYDKEIIETYTENEIEILLKKPDVKKCSFLEYRNWVIINFLMATGCRAKTLVNIKIKDLDFENDLITYSHTKNRKQQLIPMSNLLKQVLIEYLQYRNGKEDDYLFINAYGDYLKVDQLSHNLNDYNKKRGVIKTGVHRWRHTFAKMWILQGGDIFRLQKILGHSSLDIVKEYVDMFTNDLQKDFNEFNPLEQVKGINKKHMKITKNLYK